MKLSELIEKYGDCEVTDELMKMVKPKGYWKPKKGENYWFMYSNGNISNVDWIGCNGDLFRIAKRNCYQTKEEAQFALDMYNFCKGLSFEPDWEDFNQIKLSLYLDYGSREVCWNSYGCSKRFAPFYYPSKEAVKEVIDKYSFEELEKYYGRV